MEGRRRVRWKKGTRRGFRKRKLGWRRRKSWKKDKGRRKSWDSMLRESQWCSFGLETLFRIAKPLKIRKWSLPEAIQLLLWNLSPNPIFLMQISQNSSLKTLPQKLNPHQKERRRNPKRTTKKMNQSLLLLLTLWQTLSARQESRSPRRRDSLPGIYTRIPLKRDFNS